MVAAEMLEEKRKKAEEEDMFDDIGAEAGQVGWRNLVDKISLKLCKRLVVECETAKILVCIHFAHIMDAFFF